MQSRGVALRPSSVMTHQSLSAVAAVRPGGQHVFGHAPHILSQQNLFAQTLSVSVDAAMTVICCSMLGHRHPKVWPHHPGLAPTTLVTSTTASGI